jgi:uncharacterized protein YndB with AHSA1/START domain
MEIATEESTRLEIRRLYKQSPADVYAAWTDPAQLKVWWRPHEGFAEPEVSLDLRVGGRYRIVMHAPDGQTHRVGGVYREVQPGRKLVFTWAWESTPDRESLVTLEFKAAGQGTELLLTHNRFADSASRDRHQHGWDGCIAGLDKYLSR